MRRGGYGKERSDQPGKKPVTITTLKVLHPVTRAFVNGAWVGGGITSLFLWDYRYIAAGLMVVLGGCIFGPWQPPQEPQIIQADPNWKPDLGDDEVHL